MNTLQLKGSLRLLLILAATFAIASCQSPKKLSKTIQKISFRAEPEVLEVNGDSVLVTIKGKFPPHAFPKNALVKFQPILHYGDSIEVPLNVMYLKGEKVKGEQGKTINTQKGGSFTYTDKFEYKPEMKKSQLSLDYNIKLDSKYDELDQCLAGTSDTSFYGTITTSLTVKPTDDVYMLDTIRNQGAGGRKVIFYYVINEGTLRDSAKKGPAMQEIHRIVNDSSFVIEKIIFHGYASPDGETSLNVNLTQQRTKSAMTLIQKELKKLGYTKIYDSTFMQQPDNGEDWAGLERLVRKSPDFDGKQDVLNIITNSALSPDDKEARLRQLPAWNAMLVNNLLPKLRRTEVVFQGNVPSRSVDSLVSMAKDTAQLWEMSKRELIMLANATPDSDTTTLLHIYKHMMTRFPDDWAGKNNYAAVILKSGNYQEGNRLFEELHATYPDNDTITSNLGVAKRFLRKYDDAKNLYTDAQQGGVKENNNLGILYIKYGDYESAVNSFEPDRCDYNVALAYTLKGDYDMALQKIDCITDKTADVYYLRAIVGARKGDKDLMTTSLTRAVQMDPSIRDRAKNDLEFRKFNTTAEFQNAIR